MKKRWITAAAALVAVPAVTLVTGLNADASPSSPAYGGGPAASSKTTTPIKHLVVIFDENVSFDHYFGTYPYATNPSGEPSFTAAKGTPTVNGLSTTLLKNNPNKFDPTRLDRSQAVTCDQNHSYGPEQGAFDHGLMDQFVQDTQSGDCSTTVKNGQTVSTGEYYTPNLVMDYYDGNTVTGLWNYAQHYAMSDNSYDTVFGPSTPGALNLISGDNAGATGTKNVSATGVLYGDADPAGDLCDSSQTGTATMTGTNIGDLLNQKDVTWGWFQGGFKPTSVSNGVPVCGASHANVAGNSSTDYSPHHEPFQYYASTANPQHLPPSSASMIGKTDQANHQYDLSDFWTSVDNGNMPSVSFLKAPEYQDGHAGYSDPLDEQNFLVTTINRLQKSPDWKDTAVVINYDDSDGWYDHQMSPIVSESYDATAGDQLTDPGACGPAATNTANPPKDVQTDRCGYGPRLPLLVISPYAKTNYVDNTLTDQTSILKFVEDNWSTGSIPDTGTNKSFDRMAGPITNMFDFSAHPDNGNDTLILDPTTGEPARR